MSGRRFVSLDVLRGITIVGMIFVNTQGVGRGFDFLIHSSWDGCTFADLVYPFFLFIVGASMFFSFHKTNYELNRKVVLRILKRGALIFLIGFLINIYPFTDAPSTWRIPGVLQRTAFVYVVVSFLVLWLKSTKILAIISGVILLAYWALIAATGMEAGDNVVRTVDCWLFGESHLYTLWVMGGVKFDPEGALSSISAMVNALIGYLTAVYLFSAQQRKKTPYAMLWVVFAMLLVALVWNQILPFNKPMWSSSFVLYTCGWALLVWFVLYWIIDVKSYTAWTSFFLAFGTNALFAYILSEILLISSYRFPFTIGGEQFFVHTWLDEYLFSALGDSPLRPMMWGATMLLVCWATIYPLYRKRIFIRL